VFSYSNKTKIPEVHLLYMPPAKNWHGGFLSLFIFWWAWVIYSHYFRPSSFLGKGPSILRVSFFKCLYVSLASLKIFFISSSVKTLGGGKLVMAIRLDCFFQGFIEVFTTLCFIDKGSPIITSYLFVATIWMIFSSPTNIT